MMKQISGRFRGFRRQLAAVLRIVPLMRRHAGLVSHPGPEGYSISAAVSLHDDLDSSSSLHPWSRTPRVDHHLPQHNRRRAACDEQYTHDQSRQVPSCAYRSCWLIALHLDLIGPRPHPRGVVPCLHAQQKVHAKAEGFFDPQCHFRR